MDDRFASALRNELGRLPGRPHSFGDRRYNRAALVGIQSLTTLRGAQITLGLKAGTSKWNTVAG
jgi:hypothetical protein